MKKKPGTKMSAIRKARAYEEFATNMLELDGSFDSPVSEWDVIRDQPCDDDRECDVVYLVVTPKDTFREDVNGVDDLRFLKKD